MENIEGAALTGMELIIKFHKWFRFLVLSAIDAYKINAWIIPLKEKKTLLLLMLFKKIKWV